MSSIPPISIKRTTTSLLKLPPLSSNYHLSPQTGGSLRREVVV
jgi:hypothetical protein